MAITKKSKKKAKKILKWGVCILAPILVIGYLGLLAFWPSEWAANKRLHASASWIFEGRVSDAENAPTFHQTLRQVDAAKVELASNRNAIEHYSAPCPQDTHWDGNLKRMDLTGCDAGDTVWPQLKDPYQVQRYAVKFYKYGRGEPQSELEKKFGKQLIRIESESVIEVMRQSPHFVAKKVGPGLYDLGGEVKFKYLGDADAVTLELVP